MGWISGGGARAGSGVAGVWGFVGEGETTRVGFLVNVFAPSQRDSVTICEIRFPHAEAWG